MIMSVGWRFKMNIMYGRWLSTRAVGGADMSRMMTTIGGVW